MKKNILVPLTTLITISILILGFYCLVTKNKIESNSEIEQVAKYNTINNTVFSDRESVRSVYLNSSNLPVHNTVCLPEKKFFCSIDGCEPHNIGVFNLISGNSKDGSLSRCDKKPCDTYPVTKSESGNFKVLQTEPEHGMLFKMSYVDLSYTEIVTLGTDSFITFGKCDFIN